MISGGNVVYGMASAFRRDVIEPFMDIKPAGSVMTHDTWLALCATAIGHPGLASLSELVAYRVMPCRRACWHDENRMIWRSG